MKKFFAIALIAATTFVACNSGETKSEEAVDSAAATVEAAVDTVTAVVDSSAAAVVDTTAKAVVDSAK